MTINGEERREDRVGQPNESSAVKLYCSLPMVPERVLSPEVNPPRARLIRSLGNMWTNGTVLHYYFFSQPTDGRTVVLNEGTSEWRAWTAEKVQKDVVRRAFSIWKDLGVGLEFEEVESPDEAEMRIGFEEGDGSWCYVGREMLEQGRDKRTTNFGWDLTETEGIDTALHEIGHAMGLEHEHQTPNAGLEWEEEAVYEYFAGEPNWWPRNETYYNVIRKISPDEIQGSSWDPNSVMEYQFAPHLIKRPEEYWEKGLTPAGGLSERDKAWVKNFYPPLKEEEFEELVPFKSVRLAISEGEQRNFVIRPEATRQYSISTFGTSSDTVMVLFDVENGTPRYLTAEDDSGEPHNANFRVKLFKGHKYILRIRLYWQGLAEETAVMMW